MSVSPGAIGGGHHLRQSLVFLDMPVLQQPEAYADGAATLFADDGSLAKDGKLDFFRTFMPRYTSWIETILG